MRFGIVCCISLHVRYRCFFCCQCNFNVVVNIAKIIKYCVAPTDQHKSFCDVLFILKTIKKMITYKYRTVTAIGHRRTPKFFSINVGISPGSRDRHRGGQCDCHSAGQCLWIKKLGCVRVGFVWERQWLTLCSICFFAGRKCFLGYFRKKNLKTIEMYNWNGKPGTLDLAVLAWGQVAGCAAAATGQVIPGIAIGNL